MYLRDVYMIDEFMDYATTIFSLVTSNLIGLS